MPRISSSLRPRVLVIERDIEIQKSIAGALQEAYVTDLTSSGSLAMLLMKDFRYVCILASYELPNRHRGSGILDALRGMPGGKYVPVIATGRAAPHERTERVTSEGFAAWLELPHGIPNLASSIEGVLETWD